MYLWTAAELHTLPSASYCSWAALCLSLLLFFYAFLLLLIGFHCVVLRALTSSCYRSLPVLTSKTLAKKVFVLVLIVFDLTQVLMLVKANLCYKRYSSFFMFLMFFAPPAPLCEGPQSHRSATQTCLKHPKNMKMKVCSKKLKVSVHLAHFPPGYCRHRTSVVARMLLGPVWEMVFSSQVLVRIHSPPPVAKIS